MRWCHRLETPDAEFVDLVRTVKYSHTHTLTDRINITREHAASRVCNLTAYARYTILLFCVCVVHHNTYHRMRSENLLFGETPRVFLRT